MLKHNWGQILKEQRQKIGLTQQDIADIMNKTRIHVHHLESQKRPPKAQDLSIYADAVGLDISLLFESNLPLASQIIQLMEFTQKLDLSEIKNMTNIDYIRLSKAAIGEIALKPEEIKKLIDSLSLNKDQLLGIQKATVHKILKMAQDLGLKESDLDILKNFLEDKKLKSPGN